MDSLDGRVDVGVGVRRRDDHVQEVGRTGVDAEAEELVDEAPVDDRVGVGAEVAHVVDRLGLLVAGAKRQHLEHRPDALDDGRDGSGGERVGEALCQPLSTARHRVPGRAVVFGQHVEALGRHREGEVGCVLGPVVQHAAAGEDVHDAGRSGDGGEREPGAQRLPERGEVARDAVERLTAARVEAKAGHRLVDDQHRAVLVAQTAHLIQIAGPRRDDAHVGHDRLCDHRRHPSLVPGEAVGQELGVVPRADDRVGRGSIGDARRRRHRRRMLRPAREDRVVADADEDPVEPAVVVALELDDQRTAGQRPGDPDRRHRGLGPGVGEPHPLCARDEG